MKKQFTTTNLVQTLPHCLGSFQKAKEFHEAHLKIAKEVRSKVEEAKAYYSLSCTLECLNSLPEAVDCCQLSVKILDDLRFRGQLTDEWKIDLRNNYQDAYVRLWLLLLKQGKVVEALLAAEKGRAQALKDLMKLQYRYDVEAVECTSIEGTTCERDGSPPSISVFTALSKDHIFFWVIQKGGHIELRAKETGDVLWTNDKTNLFQSLIQSAYDEIGVREGMKCEDRSLDDLTDENLENEWCDQHTESITLNLQETPLRKLFEFLIAPVADLIHGKEVVLIPDGPLALVPYAALVDSNSKYFSESHKIRVIPSLTTLRMIENSPADCRKSTGALLVGDPWVQEYNFRGRKLDQLPCAREEVEMIGRILNTEPLTGTAATKDAVLERLSSVAIVHIAAHGQMETGEIALAPSLTRTNQVPTEEDFLLTMKDVLSVQLRARLVVLSCCHSGRGEIKAEGVVGIARAFMGAGARSVLVTLWAIDDEATMVFMTSFYKHLTEGAMACEALSKAMKYMRESDIFSEVKYWAPFVLHGDDVTLELEGHKPIS